MRRIFGSLILAFRTSQTAGRTLAVAAALVLGVLLLLASPAVSFVPQCVAPPSDLVSWWPGDGNADDIVGGNDGTLMNGATFAAGKVDQAFSFDGVNDFVQIPNAALNNMPAGTIDMWIFPTANGTAAFGFGKTWFAKQHNNVNSYAIFAFKSPTDSRALFHLNNQAPDVVGATPLTLNTWHHVAATWDGSFIRVYVDGVQEGVVASSASLPSDLGSVTSIGAWTGDGNSFFKGRIDEVETFNRALTQSEIQAIFNAGSAGKCGRVPFAAFSPKVEITLGPGANDDAFEVKAPFTLGTGSDGIDPLTEIVKLELTGGTGSFSTTIPAGSFEFRPAKPGKKGKPGKPAEFRFEGVIDGVALEVKIADLGVGMFEFKAEGTGADLTGTVNPVTVKLIIGDDGGSASVTAEFE